MNITEFARHLGLSISTVSRALNGYEDVKPETRELVLRSAERLGYVPNAASRRLRRKKRLETVGFVAPRHDREFLSPVLLETLTGLDTVLEEKGLNLNVLSLHAEEDELKSIKSQVVSGAVDALILSRTRRFDPRVSYLNSVGFPFVTFGCTETDEDYRYVEIDHYCAGEASVRHLTGLGHRRIALLNGPEEFMLHHRRRQGYEAAMAAAGCPLDADLVRHSDPSPQASRAAARELLSLDDRPSAIVCASDHMAHGVYAVAAELGIEVGPGLSIIGCDDISSSDVLAPPLTTATADRYRAGKALAELLLAEGDSALRNTRLDMTLVVRKSTAPFKGTSP
ncbi:LacI family DNA-binding transcriptional regulator [Rhodobium gokarnense]|uniref:LacI family transcriptional regulator n=1 Tax=Rhodobium gokarnense TaxID=364296 RepID=A0ABT3H6D0_9HYPH|nr:LacI family DNA-binding transcriptional regulator [Rhodobium gokarnense]MCW2305945.1 LacI family transcriptional regulator [Rhodobium gokarnense]